MAKPNPSLVPDLLKALSTAKPAEAEAKRPGVPAGSKSPMPKVKASTKPVKSTMSQTRTSNRGK